MQVITPVFYGQERTSDEEDAATGGAHIKLNISQYSFRSGLMDKRNASQLRSSKSSRSVVVDNLLKILVIHEALPPFWRRESGPATINTRTHLPLSLF